MMRLLRQLERHTMQKYTRDDLFLYYKIRMFYFLLLGMALSMAVLFFSFRALHGMTLMQIVIVVFFISLGISSYLLYIGRSRIAGFFFIATLTTVIWIVMFFGKPLFTLSRFDTIAFVYVVLVFCPIFLSRNALIFFYFIQLVLFAGFIVFMDSTGLVDRTALKFYFLDNVAAFGLIMLFSFLLYNVAERSHEDLRNKNEELWAINEEMEATNEELSATMTTLEGTLDELTDVKDGLEENHRHLEQVLNSMPLPVMSVRHDEANYINHAFSHQFGYVLADFFKRRFFYSLFPNESERNTFEILYNKSLKGSNDTFFSMDIQQIESLHNGARIVEIKGTRMGDDVILIFNDVTELMASRELMVQTEKMMTLGGLSAGMAHEINNPLGIISQAALMIKKRFDPASQSNVAAAQDIGIELLTLQEYLEKRHIFEYLDSIGEASSRASDIIRSTLNFSRMSKSQPVRVDVHSLLEQSISFISRDYDIKKNFDFKRINIVRNYDASVTSIVCRQTEIEQVMLNLLKNAAQALGESSSQSPEIELSTGIKGEYLSITVKNNGPEIPENLLNRIFEPFYTTKEAEKGTGLGLSVSKYIIEELHSGLLRVESKRSLGTLFTILLPFSG